MGKRRQTLVAQWQRDNHPTNDPRTPPKNSGANVNPQDRLIFALDLPTLKDAAHYIDILEPHVGAFKVGLEAFIAYGNSVLPIIQKPVMLDLKLHDIPETVERAIYAAAKFNPKFLTIHIQQPETMHRAIKAAKETNIELLGVSLLSSMSQNDCALLGLSPLEPTARAEAMVRYGLQHVLTGFVCSPLEVSNLRTKLSNYITLVVPGIRSANDDKHDQKRVGSATQAIADGASYIVVGRSIRDAKDPVAAAKQIVFEIELATDQKENKRQDNV
jgi:orotidine-5'-phosphate decarboxylase